MYRSTSAILTALCLSCIYHGGGCQTIDATFKPVVTAVSRISAMAPLPNGKWLVAGDFMVASGKPVNTMIRLNSDGSLDETFKTPPIEKLANVSSIHIAQIVVLTTGKILICGSFKSPLQRLNEDGTIDNTFTLAGSISFVAAVALQNDKLIVDTGTATNSLKRLQSNGAIDPTFTTGTPNAGNPLILCVQPSDNKILVAGEFTNFSGTAANRLIRLSLDGQVDQTFSAGLGPQNMSGLGYISQLSARADGKIIVTGSFVQFNGVAATNVVQLNSNGSVDGSFIASAPSITIQSSLSVSDGTLVAGYVSGSNNPDYHVFKLNPSGNDVGTFSCDALIFSTNDGVIAPPVLAESSQGIAVSATFLGNSTLSRPSIIFLDKTSGAAIPNFHAKLGAQSTISAAVRQPDGKIIIGGGFTSVGGVDARSLARLNVDGSLDNAFQQAVGLGTRRPIYSLALQADGKILVGGGFDAFNVTNRQQLVRLNADGTIDNSFQPNIPLVYLGPGMNAIKVLLSGKILVGGLFQFVGATQVDNVAQLNSNGTLDATFNVNLLTASQRVNGLEVLSDGSVVVAGEIYPPPPDGGGFLVKTNSDGTLTPGFVDPGLNRQGVYSVKGLPNDRILFGGDFNTSHLANEQNALFQINTAGTTVDKTSVYVTDGSISAIYSLGNEEVLVGGQFKSMKGKPGPGLFKTRLDGNAIVNYTPGIIARDRTAVINELVPANDNGSKVLFAGTFTGINGQSFYSIGVLNTNFPLAPTDLTAAVSNKIVSLSWTDNSLAETGFEIEKSADGGATFESLGTVPANTTSFTDNNTLGGPLTYRVRAAGTSGKSDYVTTIITITGLEKTQNMVAIFPNPAHDRLFIQLPVEVGQTMRFKMLSTTGQLVYSEDLKTDPLHASELSLSHLPKGLYIIHVETEGINVARLFVKD